MLSSTVDRQRKVPTQSLLLQLRLNLLVALAFSLTLVGMGCLVFDPLLIISGLMYGSGYFVSHLFTFYTILNKY